MSRTSWGLFRRSSGLSERGAFGGGAELLR
jgi:hypothetical protein